MAQIYVSITGLKLHSAWHAPRFWSLAMPAMAAAQSAPGNLGASARTLSGVHHTLSFWRSEVDMRAYLRSPAHRRAIRAFPRIASGKTYGFLTDTAPEWDEALVLWQHHGRLYGDARKAG